MALFEVIGLARELHESGAGRICGLRHHHVQIVVLEEALETMVVLEERRVDTEAVIEGLECGGTPEAAHLLASEGCPHDALDADEEVLMFPDYFGDVVLVEGPSVLQCWPHFRRDRSLPLLLDEEPDGGLQLLLGLGIEHLWPLAEGITILPHDLELCGLLPDLPLEHGTLYSMVSQLLLKLGDA